MFNITLWTEQKFPEIIEKIYNAIFISVCQIYPTRMRRSGENSTWINDLFPEYQKEMSKVVNRMKIISLGPKRVKLSQFNDYNSNWQILKYMIKKREIL